MLMTLEAIRLYEDQMETYRHSTKYRDYQNYLNSFKKAPGKSIRASLQQSPQKASDSSPSKRSDSCDTDDSAGYFISPPDTETDYLRKDSQETLIKAMVDLRRFKMRYNDVATYCSTRLPDETITREAVTAFVRTVECSIFAYTDAQAEALLNHVYQKNGPVDALSLAEVCISAAMGSHYVGRQVPKRCIWEFFASCCVLLDTVPVCEATYLRIMRLFLCLTLYSIVEKHLSACSFISKLLSTSPFACSMLTSYTEAGLSIARWKFPLLPKSGTTSDGTREDWRKVYRSFIHLDT
jgi:hypothetical protein